MTADPGRVGPKDYLRRAYRRRSTKGCHPDEFLRGSLVSAPKKIQDRRVTLPEDYSYCQILTAIEVTSWISINQRTAMCILYVGFVDLEYAFDQPQACSFHVPTSCGALVAVGPRTVAYVR